MNTRLLTLTMAGLTAVSCTSTSGGSALPQPTSPPRPVHSLMTATRSHCQDPAAPARGRMTFDQMEALTQRMADDFDQLGNAGLDVVAFGPDLQRRLVRVGVRRDLARARQVMHCRYGAQVFVVIDTIQVVPIDSGYRAAATRTGGDTRSG